MDFGAKIKAFEEKALKQTDRSISKAFQTLALEAVTLTSGDRINRGGFSDGDIANNWHVSEVAPNIVMPNGPDKSGAASIARIMAFTAAPLFYRRDNKVFLTNVMNYSYRANYVGWQAGKGTNGWIWSGKVPVGYGFVQQAINNTKGKYM